MLPIFRAVGLSLGYEIETLAPVDERWTHRPFIKPPEEYKSRVVATYEAVKMGLLPCSTTAIKGKSFDINARFSDAQCWEVSLVRFRHFCDERGWKTPAEFLPNGYEAASNAPVVAGSAEQRQACRWQMCLDAGLSMPQDTYAQLPRGIKEIAKAENITRQALAQDLNAHRERLFGR